jgi:hypothetical protein
MCLDIVQSYKEHPERVVKAWKFGIRGKEEFRTIIRGVAIPIGRWVKDDNTEILTTNKFMDDRSNLYETGFHCYLQETLVRRGLLFDDCFVKEIVARGVEGKAQVVVGKKIFILDRKWFSRSRLIRLFGERFLPEGT